MFHAHFLYRRSIKIVACPFKVLMASNYYSCGLKHKIRRWDSKKRKHVKICKPLLAEAFAQGMTGTER